ncbi:hypothetical protein NI18_21170 [Sphingomonas sp. Ant20]|nr:hypothetical protein NI18_21170 [Sphingomonas sp. Ant20]
MRRDLAERLAELGPQQRVITLDAAVAPDQHVIGASDTAFRQQLTRQSPQPPFHAVTDDGVANLLGDGEADSHRLVTVIAGAHEQDESRHRCALPRIRREKIAAFRHDRQASIAGRDGQADSFLRPRARRAWITARPPTVAIRARKP